MIERLIWTQRLAKAWQPTLVVWLTGVWRAQAAFRGDYLGVLCKVCRLGSYQAPSRLHDNVTAVPWFWL